MSETYLAPADIDDVSRILMALVSEVWGLRDRMMVTEALLAEKAGISAADIDDFVPSPALAAALQAERDRFVASVVGAPLAARDRSVEQILARAGFRTGPGAGGSSPV